MTLWLKAILGILYPLPNQMSLLGLPFIRSPNMLYSMCVLRKKLYGRKRQHPRAFWSERKKCIKPLILHHPVEKHFKSRIWPPIRRAVVCRWVLNRHRRSNPDSPELPTCTQPFKGFTHLPKWFLGALYRLVMSSSFSLTSSFTPSALFL